MKNQQGDERHPKNHLFPYEKRHLERGSFGYRGRTCHPRSTLMLICQGVLEATSSSSRPDDCLKINRTLATRWENLVRKKGENPPFQEKWTLVEGELSANPSRAVYPFWVTSVVINSITVGFLGEVSREKKYPSATTACCWYSSVCMSKSCNFRRL